jgi:hypothetical protein
MYNRKRRITQLLHLLQAVSILAFEQAKILEKLLFSRKACSVALIDHKLVRRSLEIDEIVQ